MSSAIWSRRRWLVASSVGAGAVLLGCGQEQPPSLATPKPLSESEVLASLRAASLPNLSGTSEPLSQWSGRPWLLNFWATWCAPCVHEMPDLDQLQREFAQVRFIGLGIDTPANMQQFLQKVPVEYPLLDARAQGLDWARGLGNAAGGLPFTLLLDASGQIRYRLAGRINPEILRQQLRALS